MASGAAACSSPSKPNLAVPQAIPAAAARAAAAGSPNAWAAMKAASASTASAAITIGSSAIRPSSNGTSMAATR